MQVKLVQLPDSTAVGAPDGKAVSKEIGGAGGTIISDDGRVELIFPAGALTEKKMISIQPVVNLIPNGNGKGYQFEPSGTQFIKPVKVIFHYSQKEDEICPATLHFMAIQDKRGKWEYMDYEECDSTTSLLKGHITHFSEMVDGNLMELSPAEKTLKVGESFALDLTLVGMEDLSPLPLSSDHISWSLVSGRGTGTLGREGRYGATYTAPNFLPQTDAKVVVTVSRTTIERVVQSTKHKKGRWTGETRVPHTKYSHFACDIKLYDQYRVTVKHQGPSILRCGAELLDLSILQIKLYPNKGEITDVTNSEPTLIKLPNCKNESRGGRSAEYTITYDPAGCQGPVDLSKGSLTENGVVIRHQPKTSPDITIEFAPKTVKIMNGKIHYPGTPGAHTNSHFLKRQLNIPTGEAKDEPLSDEDTKDMNVGNKIQFKANRQHQEYDRQDDDIKHSFKLIIEPI